jgi:hypothetical protein
VSVSLNRRFAWLLFAAGFAFGAWLDPTAFGGTLPVPFRPLRYAQASFFWMAALQWCLAEILARSGRTSYLSIAGAALFVAGWVGRLLQPELSWLVLAGALLNLVALGRVAIRPPQEWDAWVLRVALSVLAFGLLIDAASGPVLAGGELVLRSLLGPEDALPLRMLRLARAASLALPAFVLLYPDLCTVHNGKLARAGRLALLIGTAGMAAVLASAALICKELKYLLPIPADAVLIGTAIGLALAWKQDRRVEAAGWALAGASMAVGLMVGGFAFDGPLPTPAFMGAYGDTTRSLTRLAHAYAVIQGLLIIFLSRAYPGVERTPGGGLVLAGSVITLVSIIAVATGALTPAALAAGPFAVGIGVSAVAIEGSRFKVEG